MTEKVIGIRVEVRGVRSANQSLKSLASTVRSITSAGRRAGGSLEGFGLRLTNVGRNFAQFSALITASVAAPLALIGTTAIQAGIEFESAFAGVSKTVDGVSDASGNLTDVGIQIRDAFREIALETPIAAEELARVGEVAGQLGVPADQITGFTETMALLGVTTTLSAEEAATSIARFASIFGVESENLSGFASAAGNAIVELGNNFATTEGEIVNMAMRLASAGRQFGLAESEVLGISAALSELGVRAELGGSTVSRVMLDIKSAFDTGGESAQAFTYLVGAGFEDLVANSPAEAFVAFTEALGQVEESGGNLTQTLDELGFKGVRLRDVLGRLAGNEELVADAINRSNKEFKAQNALAEEAAKRFATVESKIQLAKNAFSDLGITLFYSVREPMIVIIELVTEFLKAMGRVDPIVLKVVGGLVAFGLAIGTILTVSAVAVAALGALISAIGVLFSTFGVIIPVIGTAALGIAGLVGAITGIKAIEDLDPNMGFFDTLISLAQTARDRLSGIADTINDIILVLQGDTGIETRVSGSGVSDDLASEEGRTGVSIDDRVETRETFNPYEEALNRLGELGDKILEIQDKIETFANEVKISFEKIREEIDLVVEKAAKLAQALGFGEVDTSQMFIIETTLDNISKNLQTTADILEDMDLGLLANSLNTLAEAFNTTNSEVTIAQVMFNLLLGAMQRVLVEIDKAVVEFNAFLVVIRLLGAGITVFISAIIANIRFLSKIPAVIAEAIRGNDTIEGAFQDILDGIQKVWDENVQPVIDAAQPLVDGIVELAKTLYNVLVGNSIFPDIVNGIIKTLGLLDTEGVSVFGKFVSNIKSKAEGLKDFFSGLNPFEGLMSGLSGGGEAAGGSSGSGGGIVSGLFDGLQEGIDQIDFEGLKEKVGTAMTGASEQATTAATTIQTKFTLAFLTVQTLGTASLQILQTLFTTLQITASTSLATIISRFTQLTTFMLGPVTSAVISLQAAVQTFSANAVAAIRTLVPALASVMSRTRSAQTAITGFGGAALSAFNSSTASANGLLGAIGNLATAGATQLNTLTTSLNNVATAFANANDAAFGSPKLKIHYGLKDLHEYTKNKDFSVAIPIEAQPSINPLQTVGAGPNQQIENTNNNITDNSIQSVDIRLLDSRFMEFIRQAVNGGGL